MNHMRERAGRGGSEEWPQLHEGEEAGGPARLWWREAAGSKDILDIEEGLRSGRETQSGVLSPGGLQDARPLSDGGWDRLLTHTRGGGPGRGTVGEKQSGPLQGTWEQNGAGRAIVASKGGSRPRLGLRRTSSWPRVQTL